VIIDFNVKIYNMDYEEKIKQLRQLLIIIKDETETHISHEEMVKQSEGYLLIIAIEKYLERHDYFHSV
jgi:hypothetical protein